MAKALSDIGSINIDAAISNASTVLDRVSDAALALATSTYDNEVNHRPATQRWAVCTP